MSDTMPLWCEDFALDTESDKLDGTTVTRLVQCCPVSAVGLGDVRIWYGWDAWKQFFQTFEETRSKKKLKCHCYNLGGYEYVGILKDVLSQDYTFTQGKNLKNGEWSWVADDKTVYQILIRGHNGTVLEFTDDMRRTGGVSMKELAESVRNEHPDWFPFDKVKEETDYHEGWLNEDDPSFDDSIHYAKVDAYSQAMISRYLIQNGYDLKLTAPSNGMEAALSIKYRNKDLKDCSFKERRWARNDFTKHYPPLNREMQDIAEKSLLGGFVWGVTGTHKGTFTHLDYSSSYPFEYAYGELFIGRVDRLIAGTPLYDKMKARIMKSTELKRWLLVSFDFHIRDGMLGAISGREVKTELNPMTGRMNKKMRKGHIQEKLYTESYLKELGKHYYIENMVIHEVWYAKKRYGDFEPMIREFYTKKNALKAEGKDGTAEYRMNKLFLNGGIHGKTITKTHRRERIWNQDEGKVEYVDVETTPTLNFMLGFTAMMNGRERLLRHCRMMIESGHRILMCDTDSMVTDATPEQVREVIGDWFMTGEGMETDLGRFDIENDKKGLKKAVKEGLLTQDQADSLGVSETFDTFKCWGLKRYCEIRTTPYGEIYRKSAFAGMHDDNQRTLMDLETDGTVYEWKQRGKKTGERCVSIVEVTKHMKAENIWDEEIELTKVNGNMGKMKEIYGKLVKDKKEVLEG